jgi:carbonic anhydrase/acetyltransferase-like protein (isoleucine patch superfamily)
LLLQLDDRRVQAENGDYWVADSAMVMGSVLLKKGASVWFNAVLW